MEDFFSITRKGQKTLEAKGYREATNEGSWCWDRFGKRDRQIAFWEENGKIKVSLVSVTDPTKEDPRYLEIPKWLEIVSRQVKMETEDFKELSLKLIKETKKDLKDTIITFLEDINYWDVIFYKSKTQEDIINSISLINETWRKLYIQLKEEEN